MKTKLVFTIALVTLLSALALIAAPTTPVMADSTVTVSPTGMNGWFFHNDGNPTPLHDFAVGPGTAPLNNGSVHFYLPGSARGAIATVAFAGTRLDQITNLEYSTYRSSVDAGNNLAIAFQFDIDYDLTDTNIAWQGRLVYEPYQTPGQGGTIVQNTWQTWTPLTGRWWASGAPGNGSCGQSSPCTWATILGNWPNAGIRTSNGLIHLKAGGPAAGFDGNADKLIVGVNSNNTTFDFEPVATPGLNFQPTSAGLAVGATQSVVIDLNSVTDLYGYQFEVNYNSNVTATAYFYNGFFDTTGGSTPTGWNQTCGSNVCKFGVTRVRPQNAVSGSGALVVINFTGVTPGTVPLTFTSDLLSDRDGSPIAHNKGTATLTVYGATTISGTVQMQGRATPITAGFVTVTDQSGYFPPTVVNFSAADGTFTATVPALAGGTTYRLDASHSLYLGNRLSNQTVSPGTPLAVATTKLLGGDADDSGLIDLSDLTIVGGQFGNSGAGITDARANINADNDVNIFDLVLPGGNFSLTTPQDW